MSKHTIFCDKVGIKKAQSTDLEANYHQIEPVDGGFYKKVLRAHKWKTHHYQFLVTIIHILQLLQIIFGATATAISASKVPTIAVTVLTAIVTVVAGILAFIRGHLDRAHQLQNDLRKVRDYIRFKEMGYRESAPCDTTVKVAMEEAMVKEVKHVTVKEMQDVTVKEVKDVTAEVEKAKGEVEKAKEEVDKAMAEVEKLYYNAVAGKKGDKTKSPGA